MEVEVAVVTVHVFLVFQYQLEKSVEITVSYA